MKIDPPRLEAMGRAWPASLRLVLLHGPDGAASRDLADHLVRRLSDPGNPLAIEDLAGGGLGADPQALVAAASSVSMFGDQTLVRVTGLDDEGHDAVAALLAGPGGNPVIAIGGVFKKGSRLLALAETSEAIAALISYEPGLRDAARIVAEIGAPLGLRPSRDAATAVFEAAGGDRMVIRREVEKLGLYLDSAVDRPKSIELADVAAIGVGAADSDQYALVAAVAGGRPDIASDLFERGRSVAAIVTLRAIERRLVLLLALRGVVDGGVSAKSAVENARPPIFWKERDAVVTELGLWSTPALVRGLGDILAAERAIKSSGSLGETLAVQAILLLARRAASRR